LFTNTQPTPDTPTSLAIASSAAGTSQSSTAASKILATVLRYVASNKPSSWAVVRPRYAGVSVKYLNQLMLIKINVLHVKIIHRHIQDSNQPTATAKSPSQFDRRNGRYTTIRYAWTFTAGDSSVIANRH
jgi:hypothetical protein